MNQRGAYGSFVSYIDRCRGYYAAQGYSQSNALPEGRKTIGIILGDAVPQQFIPKLIDLYKPGRFPFNRLIKFYPESEEESHGGQQHTRK